jgi:Na+/alanine symporter
MNLDAGRLAIALGGTAAILWVICSALVAAF